MASSLQELGNPREDSGSQTPVVRGCTMTSQLHCLTAVLGLLFDGAIVFLSGGVPYWYYHFAHPKLSDDIEVGDMAGRQHASETISNLKEHWSNTFQQLSKMWKAQQIIVGTVLAIIFPFISVSPLPECSWAYFFAILCLLYGLVTFTICVVHQLYFNTIDASKLYISWDGGFFRKDVLRFYGSLSLPTVWFPGFVVSLAMTILMLMVGVQELPHHLDIDPSASSTACHNKARFLLVVVPLIIVLAFTSSIRGIGYALKHFQAIA